MLNHEWQKATASNPYGNCLQARWTKSSFSYPASCVETRQRDNGQVEVRDSKLGECSPILTFTPDEWQAFIAGAKSSEFDLG